MNLESQQFRHQPVLLEETLNVLSIQADDFVIDGTLGLGGHTKAILKELTGTGRVMGFDLDSRNMKEAQKRLSKYEGKILFVNDSYSRVEHYAKVLRFERYNKVLLDLGVSSPHFDVPEYGFSFQLDGPLDMRFNDKNSVTAASLLNQLPEEELANILFEYGELKNSRRIAGKIVEERKIANFTHTVDFVDRISGVFPELQKHKMLACVFQALRIAVNDELNTVESGIKALFEGMEIDGIMAVISYHSLEDRIVKNYFQELLRPIETDPEKALKSLHADPKIEILTKKIIVPGAEEVKANPRARSAKLRAIKKLSN